MPPTTDSAARRPGTGADPLVALAPRLRQAFEEHRYDADSLLEVLGDDVHAALGRGEPVPVRRAAAGAGELGVLIRLLLVGDPVPRAEAAAALSPLDLDAAVAAGLFEASGPEVRAALDVRPMDLGHGTRWMISDLDGSMRPHATSHDHVLGVGHASLSLLRATPVSPTGTVLDLGTGCGVQAVHAAGYARSVTATDVSTRALRFAAAGGVLNGVDITLEQGPWYSPVAGRRFDRIVANPPFVVGRGTVDHTYRDSGLPLDGAGALMLSEAPEHLAPDGVATMLASWVHLRGDDWRSRVAGWLPDHGVEAWIVQRDVADPALYVGTWMRDAGLDPREDRNTAMADEWLACFEEAGVEGVGFGFVYLQRTDEPTSITAEDLRHGFDDPLGAEALDHLARAAWLRGADVTRARFRFHPATALERVSLPAPAAGEPGADPDAVPWREVVTRLHRGDGPRWQHDVDAAALRLLSGLGRGALTTADVAGLLAAAEGADPGAVLGEAAELVTALVRHGMLLPADGPGTAP